MYCREDADRARYDISLLNIDGGLTSVLRRVRGRYGVSVAGDRVGDAVSQWRAIELGTWYLNGGVRVQDMIPWGWGYWGRYDIQT